VKDDADPADDPDPNDRLTKISRDPVERQLDVNEAWANGKDSRFAYDVGGNVLSRRTDGKIQPDGSFGGDDRKVTTFEYDSLDREFRNTVDPMVGSDRETVTNYWPSGRRQSRRKPNGTSDRWFYDTRGMVTRHERVRAGQTDPEDDDVDYRYDDNGNRDRDERGTYLFNVRDQLTKWTKPGGQVTDYTLNGDGQITKKVIDPPDGPAVTTTYEYRGERLRWAETADVRANFRYDDFGNVTRILQHAKQPNGQFPEVNDNAPQSSGCEDVPEDVDNDETYYCYDEFERLRLSKGAGVTEKPQRIEYDGLDRRDTRTFEQGETTKTRDYSYVGTSELLSREVELDGDKHFYDYDSAGDRTGQQVTSGSGDTNRFRAYVKDANGSVLGLEDDDGEVDGGGSDDKVARYEYDPYGELENAGDLSTEAQDNPFRFEGFYFDSGVKTYDMYARSYRPESGRFLTQDRLASADQDLLLQADPLTQNRYAFAGGNPVNLVEFDGHEPPSSFTDCYPGSNYCTPKNPTPKQKARGKAIKKAVNDAIESSREKVAAKERAALPASSSGGGGGGGGGPFSCGWCPHMLDPIKNAASDLGGAAADTASDSWTGIKHFPGWVGSQATCRIPRNGRGDHPACPDQSENFEALQTATLAAGFSGVGKKFVGSLAARFVTRLGAKKAPVMWVDEAAAMSADAAEYQAGAIGARSSVITRKGQAPALNYVDDAGNPAAVRFDGYDDVAGELIDRKLSVTTFPKSQKQALSQSRALAQSGYRGVWEVPSQAQATRADRMFGRLGITNITTRVVPR